MTSGANPRTLARQRSPLLADLVIIFLGTWGFVRQCLRVLFTKGRTNELERGG